MKSGYKQTEVGVIPEDWEVKEFGELTERIIGGGTPSRSNPLFWGNEIPWVTVKDFATFNRFQAQEYITREGLKNSASHLIPKGVIITSTRMALGKAVIYDIDVSINQDLKAIFPKKYIETKFLFYWFQFNSKYIEDLGSGSTVMGLSLPDLRQIKVKIPTKAEQAAIATALSDVDALISALNSEIAKKRLIKQGAMQELLSGKKRLAGFSGEWEVKQLKEIAEFFNGKAHEQFINENGDYIVINSKFISTEGEVFKTSSFSLFPLNKADITMVMSDIPNGKALAKCYFVEEDNKYTLNQRICSIKSEITDNKFLFFILNRNNYFLAFDSGVGQTNLKKQQILDCPLFIPPTKEEQTAIAQILSDMDSDIQALETERNKTQAIKQGMMQELLTGKIRLINPTHLGKQP